MEENKTLFKEQFPRSNAYDPDWVMDCQMGPNALWLMEWLTNDLDLKPGMRVLDLGCGRAMTSIFLAKEFGVRVWANDLWIHPDDNWERIKKAGMDDLVCPTQIEAHALPFAQGFFDAVVSIDAYQYFGTDILYVGYISRFLVNGGSIGVVVPGLMQEMGREIPEHLTRELSNGAHFWEDDCISFKTAPFWRDLWEQSKKVDQVKTETLQDGWKLWRDFEIATEKAGKNIFPSVAEALEADQGRYIGFVKALARKKEKETMNLYDPALISRMDF